MGVVPVQVVQVEEIVNVTEDRPPSPGSTRPSTLYPPVNPRSTGSRVPQDESLSNP